jgi:hypothetical protein
MTLLAALVAFGALIIGFCIGVIYSGWKLFDE